MCGFNFRHNIEPFPTTSKMEGAEDDGFSACSDCSNKKRLNPLCARTSAWQSSTLSRNAMDFDGRDRDKDDDVADDNDNDCEDSKMYSKLSHMAN